MVKDRHLGLQKIRGMKLDTSLGQWQWPPMGLSTCLPDPGVQPLLACLLSESVAWSLGR